MKLKFLLIPFYFFILLIDLGNPDALRQGTEGFYLQVAKETYNAGNVVTPLYLGNLHFSKPPLTFNLAYPFFYSLGTTLFAARFSILLLSFLLLILICQHLAKNYRYDFVNTFSVFILSIGFLKYTRIYMMESYLALLPYLSSLFFLSYLQKQKKSFLAWAIIFSIAGSHIKGPISCLLQITSLIILYFFHRRIFQFKIKTFLPFVFMIGIGSLAWMATSYILHGSQFLEYFLFRENFGKLSAQSYPFYNIILGLIIFSLPWSFVLTKSLISNLFKTRSFYISNDKILEFHFVLIHFIVFFLFWFIPNQKSFHYAIPSLPFFLHLIFFLQKENFTFESLKARRWIPFLSLWFLNFLSFLLLIRFPSFNQFKFLYHTGIVFLIIPILLKRKYMRDFSIYSLVLFVQLSTVWSSIGPTIYLPLIPERIREEFSSERRIASFYRKPFFISEGMGRDIPVVPLDSPQGAIDIQLYDKVIIEQSQFEKHLKENFTIEKSWPVWKRGIKLKEIASAIAENNPDKLQLKMIVASRIQH